MKTSNISQIKLFGVAGIFTASAMIMPLLAMSSASAAAIPKSQKFADIEDCKAKVSKHTAAEINTYLNDRFEKRSKTLDGLDVKVDQYYEKNKKRVDSAEAKYYKNAKKSSGIKADFLSKDREYQHKVISTTRSQLNALKTTGNSRADVQGKADAVCAMMYKLRVNTYVAGLVAWLRQVDYNRTGNTVDVIRKADTMNIYNARKSRYDKAESASAAVSKLSNPEKLDAKFEKVTQDAKAITPDYINAADPPKAFQQFQAKSLEASDLFRERVTQTKSISEARKDLAKVKLKKASNAKKSTKQKAKVDPKTGGTSSN